MVGEDFRRGNVYKAEMVAGADLMAVVRVSGGGRKVDRRPVIEREDRGERRVSRRRWAVGGGQMLDDGCGGLRWCRWRKE